MDDRPQQQLYELIDRLFDSPRDGRPLLPVPDGEDRAPYEETRAAVAG